MSFVGLHTHSDYSLLDGASQIPDLVEKAIELEMNAIALTDHGVMYGAIELIKVCRSKTIKPIIGNEMYVINGLLEQKGKPKKYHQIVLAKNTQGYKNLVKLTTISHLQGFRGNKLFGRPCINKELLQEYHEDLIVTSGCRAGEVPQLILQGKLEEATKCAKWYKDLFGDDYYLEIQDHGYLEDRIVNVELVKIGKALGIKIVATNDSHFTECTDVEAHDALLCINTKQTLADEDRMRYSGTEYLKSAQEMAQLFRDHLPDDVIQQAIANTEEVAKKVEQYNILGEPRLPNYNVPPGHTADTYVQEKAWEGLIERLKVKSRNEIDTVYRERLEYEIKMIEKMGFSTYFLVVWDYIKYARDKGIPVGPGRGSAAGSLVAYALRITNIDPVHHGLLFERFLNPERKSMPDIDTDFCIERRDDVIKYVTDTYGADKVAQIITFNRMTSKAVLKDVARVLDIEYKDSDRMTKLIPVSRGKPEKLKVMISDKSPDPEFRSAYENDIKMKNRDGNEVTTFRQWLDMAMRIEGTNKSFGVHAAGIVISAQPLDEIVPLQKNSEGAVITQYPMEDLESLGLLKMDFLGLKNLTMIKKTVDLIKKTKKQTIDPDNIPLNEREAQKVFTRIKKFPEDVEKTYKLLEKGALEGIFQLESSGMLDVVKKLKPTCIEDISSILALYRPGPLDAGLIPQFIDRKHGREKVEYEHQLLEPILQETYGTLCYQEQIMKMAQDLAGYSLGEADLLRRAIGKKKIEEMQKQREKFIDGSTANGVTKRIADKLFEQMVKFAEYCFNKSHSTAYAYVTYQTAYLKANYQEEYMAALLTANSDDLDKVQKYIANCQELGMAVEGPDINRSEEDFTPSNDGKILFGLSAVKNVGEGAIQNILRARKQGEKFEDLANLCDRIDLHAVNSRALESLIKCGALDSIIPNRKQAIEHLPLVVSWAQKSKETSLQPTLFDLSEVRSPAPKPPQIEDFHPKDKLQFEKELLGFYVSDHPLKYAEKVAKLEGIEVINLSQLGEQKGKKSVTAIVMLTEIKQVFTKKGEPMAILQMEDLTGKAEAVVFPKTYDSVKSALVANNPVIVKGKADKRENTEEMQLIVDEIKPIEPEQLTPGEQIAASAQQEPQLTVMLELTPQHVNDKQLINNLQASLKECSDRDEVKVQVIAIVLGKSSRQLVRFGKGFWVQDIEGVLSRLNNLGLTARLESLIIDASYTKF